MSRQNVILKGEKRAKLRVDAAEMYGEGLSIRQISKWIHRSFGNTRTLLLEAGVELRPRGGSRGSRTT